MKNLHTYGDLLSCYFRVNIAAALEYRASFVVQAFGMLISNASFIFFWWVAFEQIGGRIGGYDFRDVLFIWSVASSSFGLATILFGNLNRITTIIVTGELDNYLLQPKDVLISLLAARTSLTAWGDLVYGLVLLALSQRTDPAAWLMYFLGVSVGALLFTAIAVSAHSCTFFFGDASVLSSLAVEFVINFCIYPLGIYPKLVRILMFSLIPAAFIVHLPLEIARSHSYELVALVLAGAAIYCLFAYWLFHKGLKRYESGNLIITRM